jgi:hypothetical protein
MPSTRKITAGIVAGFLVLIAGIVFWIYSAGAKRFERMERDVKALHQEILQRDPSRPPRPGTPIPGNAWDDYDKALAAAKADAALKAVDAIVRHDPKADRDAARKRTQAHAPTFDLLRSGVRRERSHQQLDWERGSNVQLPGLLDSQRLSNLIAVQARFLAEEGKVRQAADLLLDGCQFSRDFGSNTLLICQMISLALYGIQLDELHALLPSGDLTREDLLDLEKGLRAADLAFPKDGESMLNESLYMGYTLLGAGDGADFASLMGSPVSAFSLWRYGFSTRLTYASAYEELSTLLRRASRCDELNWTDAQKVLNDVRQEAQSSKNPIVKLVIANLLSSERVFRERRAQIRLLRAAVTWRATGTCPEIDDPFGTKLLHDEKDGLLRVWSVGRDGFDHGGIGTWKPDSGKDILVEWKR